jgi:hypothetical protein
MCERECGVPPLNWPEALPPPDDPALPARVVDWLRETVPSERWRVEALRDQPWALTTQLMVAVGRLVDGLGESGREAAELYTDRLPPETMLTLLAAHAAEARRLTELRLQLAAVERALFEFGSGS